MFKESQLHFFRSKLFFLFVIAALLITAGVISLLFYNSLNQSYHKEGQIQFEETVGLVRAKIESYTKGLRGVAAVYLTRNFKISNQEVRTYAEFAKRFSSFPGVLGFGFIRYVRPEDRPSYEREVKIKLGKSFNIKQLQPGLGKDLMVIEAIEPIEHNRQALGLDVGSEMYRRKAAIHAMKTGLPVITEQIQLVQVNKREPGFLLFFPLYEGGLVPATLEMKLKLFKGWAYAPITFSSIKSYITTHNHSALKFELYDIHESGALERILGTDFLGNHQFEKWLTIGENKWLIRAKYEQEGFDIYILLFSLASFLGLSVIFILLAVLFRNLVLLNDKSEHRAQVAESWLDTVINSSNFCILSTDTFGVINTLNKTAKNLIGYTVQEVIGQCSPSVFISSFNTDNSVALKKILSTAEAKGICINEVEVINKNGNRFPARLIVNPVFNEKGSVQGFLMVLEDLTEVFKMRKEIEGKQQQIIAASRLSLLGEMAAGLAHEINNPLSVIISKVNILSDLSAKNKLETTVLNNGLTKIGDTVFRIERLVRGLKNFSRDATTDPMVATLIKTVINDSVGLCNQRIKKSGVSIQLEISDQAKVDCRPSQLSQVFVNLLTNSLDALEKVNTKWISIKTIIEAEKVKIQFIDSGTGIKHSIADRILEPFVTTKEVGKGTGLGLSISKSIIVEHKGNLSYDMNESYTTFIIELPLSQKVADKVPENLVSFN